MDRRTLFSTALASATGLALWPSRVFAQPGTVSAEMKALSAYMAAAAGRALPPEIAEQAKHHLLDTLAAMVSGSELLPGQAAQRYVREHAGRGDGTVAGTSLTASPADAAMANGVTAHADETDDSHNASRSHPGCAVVPAALATGEALGVDGTRLLRAVALGYDVGTRVVMAMGGFDFSSRTSLATHSIAGTFCASAAAACVAALDERGMRWALDYASQQSSGIAAWRRDGDHIEKAFVFGGMPARNGVTSALVVRAGWTGVDDIFSGADNFYAAYAPKAERAKLVEGLGERWEVARTDIKKWSVGSPIQGPLDGMEAIRAKRAYAAADVRRVVVRLAPTVAAVVDNRAIPDICLQHLAAVMLVDGTVSFHGAHDKARMQDAAVLRERAKVQLVHDDALAKQLPVRVAVVEMTFADGTTLSERVTAVRGTPRNPMTRAEVVAKARDLCVPVLGADRTDRLVQAVYAIDDLASVRALKPLLQKGSS